MSQTPFELAASFQVGTVEFVAPDAIKVILDIEAPESVALNTSRPRPFHGYLLIPVDEAFLVGRVEWVTVEPAPFPKRCGLQDFGLVDLPYPRRRLRLNPIGILRAHSQAGEFVFCRGTDALPSIGTPVLLRTDAQLRSIVESGEKKRICIGSSPIAGDARVWVDPDRLCGCHLAVLGNTGSGKACSVAGLIPGSIEAAKQACSGGQPNARFINLDPNGDYSNAFPPDDSMVPTRIFKVNPGNKEKPLKVPLWFWNSAEWCAFTQASAKTQRSALMHALRWVREGLTAPAPDTSHEMRQFLRTLVTIVRVEKNAGIPWGQFPKPKSFFEKLEKWKTEL